MKVLIATVGTRGDVQPFIALGQGLRERGAEVVICTHARFREFVLDHGLGYADYNDDILQFLDSADGKMAVDGGGSFFGMVGVALRCTAKLKAMHRRGIQDLWHSVRASAPDLILFHPKALGIVDIAEKLHIPCIFAFWMPMVVSTGEYPALIFPKWPLGKFYHRLTYRLLDWGSWWGTRQYINEWREANQLSARRFRPQIQDGSGKRMPAVFGYSPAVIARPNDWDDHTMVSGYWFLDDERVEDAETELSAFIAAGEKPVYIGFGSIAGREAKEKARIVVEAVKRAGVRAILAVGWGGLDVAGLELPKTIKVVESVNHAWLFPRMAVVVHHGGCGTTAEGLRAGCPSVICPFFADQPFWGRKVYELGVGPQPIPQKQLTAANLAEAIRIAFSDSSMRRQAEALGKSIRQEDGVGVAVDFISRETGLVGKKI